MDFFNQNQIQDKYKLLSEKIKVFNDTRSFRRYVTSPVTSVEFLKKCLNRFLLNIQSNNSDVVEYIQKIAEKVNDNNFSTAIRRSTLIYLCNFLSEMLVEENDTIKDNFIKYYKRELEILIYSIFPHSDEDDAIDNIQNFSYFADEDNINSPNEDEVQDEDLSEYNYGYQYENEVKDQVRTEISDELSQSQEHYSTLYNNELLKINNSNLSSLNIDIFIKTINFSDIMCVINFNDYIKVFNEHFKNSLFYTNTLNNFKELIISPNPEEKQLSQKRVASYMNNYECIMSILYINYFISNHNSGDNQNHEISFLNYSIDFLNNHTILNNNNH